MQIQHTPTSFLARTLFFDAGGGTLYVPAGHYAINTPVSKDFTGQGASIMIHGEPSTNPPLFGGNGEGLNLSADFIIGVGETGEALRLKGLDGSVNRRHNFQRSARRINGRPSSTPRWSTASTGA